MDEKHTNLPIPTMLKRRVDRVLDARKRRGTGLSQKAYILHSLVAQVARDEEEYGLPPIPNEEPATTP